MWTIRRDRDEESAKTSEAVARRELERAQILGAHLRGTTTGLTEGEVKRLEAALQAAIGSASFSLKQPSAGVFDKLLEHAGGGSRAKGVPTVIQHAQLPGDLQGPVRSVTSGIQARNQALQARASEVMADAPPPYERLSLAASGGMQFVRTVHTNESGWLDSDVKVPPALSRKPSSPDSPGPGDDEEGLARTREHPICGGFRDTTRRNERTRARHALLGLLCVEHRFRGPLSLRGVQHR